jgi:predicted transcriptional regulator
MPNKFQHAALKKRIQKLEIENADLERWKREAIVMMGKWNEVDAFMRQDVNMKIGDSVVEKTLQYLQQSNDAMKTAWLTLSNVRQITMSDFTRYCVEREIANLNRCVINRK